MGGLDGVDGGRGGLRGEGEGNTGIYFFSCSSPTSSALLCKH